MHMHAGAKSTRMLLGRWQMGGAAPQMPCAAIKTRNLLADGRLTQGDRGRRSFSIFSFVVVDFKA